MQAHVYTTMRWTPPWVGKEGGVEGSDGAYADWVEYASPFHQWEGVYSTLPHAPPYTGFEKREEKKAFTMQLCEINFTKKYKW